MLRGKTKLFRQAGVVLKLCQSTEFSVHFPESSLEVSSIFKGTSLHTPDFCSLESVSDCDNSGEWLCVTVITDKVIPYYSPVFFCILG